ncbi:MAG: hypothetical protein M0Q49_07535 [Porticoccaceae bacterium]|nr:hypothetical protein [Porticoccaceae bacterium]
MLNKVKVCLLMGLWGMAFGAMAFVTTPNEPEPYEPFTIEVSVSHLWPPHDYIFVDVVDNVILIGYKNIGPHFTIEPPTPPLEVAVQGLPPGTYTVKVMEMALVDGSGGREWVFAEEIVIPDTPPTQPVYSFFHEGIRHYFVTASYDEAAHIQTVDEGWKIVDFGFNVWPAEGSAPDAAVPVCRFYSRDVNSHFYTADATECEELQEIQTSWQYEDIAFQALLPVANACPAGTDPVWRLYNNRHAEKDSNHRFVASSETYRTMIADGWIGEGVAFCSPPASEKRMALLDPGAE